MSPITQTKIPLSDEWATPRWLFQHFDAEFGFTLDACAKPWNAKHERFLTDGLTASWSGERVWCNPPYSAISDWLYKARCATKLGGAELVVCLVPCSPDRHWWHDHVGAASDVRLLTRAILPSGRVHFQKEDGTSGRAPFASCLVIYRRSVALSERAEPSE